jgi:predicted short-subunit dehydrogenase-like oxidoreductase (DUF2520 family)
MVKRSVFTSYALLGSGKVAHHFKVYLRHLNLPFTAWSRNGDPEFNFGAGKILPSRDQQVRLIATVQDASHILLAVSDPALAELAARLPSERTLVHFSGSASVPGVACAHPLMTFGSTQPSAGWYREIPFVTDHGVEFSEILPGFPNPSFSIRPAQRPLYHALCALAGNSTFLLWQKIAEEFRQGLDLPAEILAPFLHQVVANALSPEARSLATGPVARGDWAAVRAHLESLDSNPSLAAAYRGFLNQSAYAGIKVPETLL